jgi:hypothetical protein
MLSMPGASSANVATNGTDAPIVAWIAGDEVVVATLDLGLGELAMQTDVSGDTKPVRHPIERPALGVRPDGTSDIAFIEPSDGGGSVYHTTWDGEVTGVPSLVSGPPLPETNLVHMTHDPDGFPVLSWLEDSTLSVARYEDGSLVEFERVDDLTCDCCHQAPLFVGNSLVVAYRDLVLVDDVAIRDVSVVRSAADETNFGAPVLVADDHWELMGCPFSGPSAVTVDGDLVVAWMDARQSVHPDQASSTIWVDRSADEGITFGVDLPVTDGGIHRSPVMAVDGQDRLHLVWVTQGMEAGLSYAMSMDGGRSFGDIRALVSYSADTGSPKSPSMVVHDGSLIMTWVDNRGGNVAVWALDDLVGE